MTELHLETSRKFPSSSESTRCTVLIKYSFQECDRLNVATARHPAKPIRLTVPAILPAVALGHCPARPCKPNTIKDKQRIRLALLFLHGIFWIQESWTAGALLVVCVHHGRLRVHGLARETAATHTEKTDQRSYVTAQCLQWLT